MIRSICNMKDGSWLVLADVSLKQGGWKKPKRELRVYHTHQNPLVYRLRVSDILRSAVYTTHYQNGFWGYAGDNVSSCLNFWEQTLTKMGAKK